MKPSRQITTEDAAIVMQIFKLLINSQSSGEAQLLFNEAMELETINKYEKLKSFLISQWHNRKSWCLAFNSQFMIDITLNCKTFKRRRRKRKYKNVGSTNW